MNLTDTTLASRMGKFERQAARMIEARRLLHGDLRMERIENDEGDMPDGRGGAPDEDEEDPEDEPDDDAEEDDDAKGKSKKGKKDSDDDDDKVDRTEYDRVKRHRAAADRRNADLTSENNRLKNEVAALKAAGKDGKPDEETTARVSELETNVVERDRTITDLRIQNAFLTDNTFTWHDPRDAMRLADMHDVEIEDDGTVVGLKEALKKLAKEKPHLIKKPESDKDDDDEQGPSGSAKNGRRKGQTKKPDRAALSKTYPVLAARR